MATGDYSSARIRPDGFTMELEVSGFVAGITAALGLRARLLGTITGTFTVGETVTQATTSATAKVVSQHAASGTRPAYLILETGAGVPNFTATWTGFSSSATLAPTNMSPSYTIPGPATPYVTRTSLGYIPGTTTATTHAKNIPILDVIRYPKWTYSVTGPTWAGTIADGETLTQAGTLTTAIAVGTQSSGPALYIKTVGPGADNAGAWTGAAGSFTPDATPSLVSLPTFDNKGSGSSVKILVSLAEYVWAKDDTGGGNSGTAPTFTAFAGNFVNAAGSSEASSAVSAFAVTNDSTTAYPTVIGQWDEIAGVCMADRIEANTDFYLAFAARIPLFPVSFNGRNIACVQFDVTGATSGATFSYIATAPEKYQRATGLWHWSHRCPVKISGFSGTLTNGELLNCRARVYPIIGDVVHDTNNYTTVDDEYYGTNKLVLVYNSTMVYAYVDPIGGNNATGVASSTRATAAAAPFQHIGESIDGNTANEVNLVAGTHPGVGNAAETRRATSEWIVVRPAPGETSATVTVQLAAAVVAYKSARLEFRDVTMTLADANSHLDGEDADNFLRFQRAHFASGAFSAGRPPGYNSNLTRFHNCTGDLGKNEWGLAGTNTIRWAFHADGCTLSDATSNVCRAWYKVVACDTTGPIGFGEPLATNPVGACENAIFENNRMRNFGSGGISAVEIGITDVVTRGASVCGNSFERIVNGGAIIWLGADGTLTQCDNIICADNTASGERDSIGYNDSGSITLSRKNWLLANTLTETEASKNDDFNNALSGITRSGTLATATSSISTGHGLATGTVVTISAVTPAQYAGTFVITVTSATQFTYVMASDPGASATPNPTIIFAGHGNRIGAWAITYGVNRHSWFSGQMNGLTAAGSFCREHPGANSWEIPVTAGSQPPGSGTLPATTLFRYARRGTATGGTAGTGHSDLRLNPDSIAADFYSPAYVISHCDLHGHEFQCYGTRGAYVLARLATNATGVTAAASTGVSSVRP